MKTGGIVLLVALAALAGAARGDIFQWEWVDPGDHSQGKRESATLCPDGAGKVATPFAHLQSLDLTQAYLIAANIMGADFWQTTLTAADLTDAEVRFASFRDTTSRGFTAAQLYATASYKAKDLTGIGLGQNDLSGWNVADQNLTDAHFGEATLTGADLGRSNLTDAHFWWATLTGADLTDAEVRWADFGETTSTGFTAAQLYATASYKAKDLTGIGLDQNDLSGWNFADQDLTGADFKRATLTGADLTDAEVRGAWFSNTTSRGFTAAQLYSTASYKAKDLGWIHLWYNDMAGWDFAGQNLTGAQFLYATLTGADLNAANLADAVFLEATLTGADLSSADARGAKDLSVADAVTANMIWPDGSIHGLDLADGRILVVRDYDGESAPLPVHVLNAMTMATGGVLRMVFDADDWGSIISFDGGIPVALGGTLELTFAPGVDVPDQVGRTLTLFDWSGVTPTGTFSVASPHPWDLSNLYTTGDVTLLPEPATLAMLAMGLGVLGLRRRGSLGNPPRGR